MPRTHSYRAPYSNYNYQVRKPQEQLINYHMKNRRKTHTLAHYIEEALEVVKKKDNSPLPTP